MTKLKVNEVSKILSVGADRVLELIMEDRLVAWRFGPKTVRVCADSVEKYIKSCQLELNTNENKDTQESASSQFNRRTRTKGAKQCKVTNSRNK